jgi:hypothetical protein
MPLTSAEPASHDAATTSPLRSSARRPTSAAKRATTAAVSRNGASPTAPASPAAPATQPTRGGRRRAATRKSGSTAAGVSAARNTAKAVPAKKATGGGKTGRPYRHMPADLATVARSVDGAGAIAAHYGVPRHTARGWVAAAGPAIVPRSSQVIVIR